MGFTSKNKIKQIFRKNRSNISKSFYQNTIRFLHPQPSLYYVGVIYNKAILQEELSMTLRKLREEEREKLIDGAKKGNKFNTQIIIESFRGLMIKNYNNFISKVTNISMEEYMQECSVKIMHCIKDTKKKNYWQLTNLIEISLRNRTVDVKEKSRNFNNLNVPYGNCRDVCNEKKVDEINKFEDLILGNMTVKQVYNKFIKDRLTEEERRVFCLYISGQVFIDYANQKGVKVESVKRTFRNAVGKIRNIEQLNELRYMVLIIFMFLKNIQIFIDITELCDVIL